MKGKTVFSYPAGDGYPNSTGVLVHDMILERYTQELGRSTLVFQHRKKVKRGTGLRSVANKLKTARMQDIPEWQSEQFIVKESVVMTHHLLQLSLTWVITQALKGLSKRYEGS